MMRINRCQKHVMSEETAEYQVKAKSGIMNNNTRNEFASYGLDILKRSVLLVLYEGTDIVYEKSPYSRYPNGRILKAGQIREELIVKSRNNFTFYEIYVSVIAYELFIRLTQMRA